MIRSLHFIRFRCLLPTVRILSILSATAAQSLLIATYHRLFTALYDTSLDSALMIDISALASLARIVTSMVCSSLYGHLCLRYWYLYSNFACDDQIDTTLWASHLSVLRSLFLHSRPCLHPFGACEDSEVRTVWALCSYAACVLILLLASGLLASLLLDSLCCLIFGTSA